MRGVKDVSSISESEQVIRSLYAITSDYAAGFDRQAGRLLELGCARFDLEMGILARVEGETYQVMAVEAPAALGVVKGDEYPLANTFCCVTLAADGPVGFAHVAESELKSHPAYLATRLESYIGTPLKVNGEVWGTVNFSSRDPRPRRFCEVDIDALQLMAAWISAEIHRQQSETEIREAVSKLEHTKRSALVGDLVGAFRHELSNPLTVALSNFELLQVADENRELVEETRAALARMRDALHELGRLARDRDAQPETVELAEFLDHMLADARWRHHFRTDLRPTRVHLLEPKLFQALHNILLAHVHGARDAGADAAGPIRVSCGERDGMAEVRVASGCHTPLGSVRADILALLRGEVSLSEVPLSLAEHLITRLGGEVRNTEDAAGLETVVRLPLA